MKLNEHEIENFFIVFGSLLKFRIKVKCCLNCQMAWFPDSEYFGYCHFKADPVTPITKTCSKFAYARLTFIFSKKQLKELQILWNNKDPRLGIIFTE